MSEAEDEEYLGCDCCPPIRCGAILGVGVSILMWVGIIKLVKRLLF